MKLLLIILLQLSISAAQAVDKTIQAKWNCPISNPALPENGKVFSLTASTYSIKLPEDLFKESKEINPGVASCVYQFQKSIMAGYRNEFKDPYALRLVDDFLAFAFKNTELIKKNNLADQVVSTYKYEGKKLLQDQVSKGQFNGLESFDKDLVIDGISYPMTEFETELLDDINKKMGSLHESGNINQFIQNFTVKHAALLADYEGFKKDCTDSGTCTEKEKQRTIALKVISNAYAISGNTEALQCLESKTYEPIQDFLAKFENINDKVRNCSELDPGEYQLHKPFPFGATHILSRKSDGNYQAIFNLKFQYTDGALKPTEMMKKVRSCLKMVSPYLKGPDGKQLEVLALDQDEVDKLPMDKRPPQKKINLQNSLYRANSNNYNDAIDCPTITHEVLHLFGLCDEYQEKGEFIEQVGCRVVPASESVMKSQGIIFAQTIPQTSVCSCDEICKRMFSTQGEKYRAAFLSQDMFDIVNYDFRVNNCSEYNPSDVVLVQNAENRKKVSIEERGDSFILKSLVFTTSSTSIYANETKLECKCAATDQECLKMKEEIKQKIQNPRPEMNCPEGTFPKVFEPRYGDQPGIKMQGDELLITSTPTQTSLLHPAHFERILAGSCKDKAESYNQCAQFAYMSKNSKKCKVPPECQSDSHYLGVKK